MTQTAIKPALGLTICLYGALALGAYQLMASSPSKVQELSLGSATIDLDLGKFVVAPAPVAQTEPPAKQAVEQQAAPEPPDESERQAEPERPVAPQIQPEAPAITPAPTVVPAQPKPVAKAQHQRPHAKAETRRPIETPSRT